MYLLSVRKLVADLKADAVSERDKVLYLLVGSVFSTIVSDPIFSIGLNYSLVDAVNLVGIVLLIILGTLYLFKKNAAGDNREFLVRYICLSVPIGLRVIVLAVVVGLAIGIIEEILAPVPVAQVTQNTAALIAIPPYTTSPVMVVAIFGLVAFFYYYMGQEISKIAQRDRDNGEE